MAMIVNTQTTLRLISLVQIVDNVCVYTVSVLHINWLLQLHRLVPDTSDVTLATRKIRINISQDKCVCFWKCTEMLVFPQYINVHLVLQLPVVYSCTNLFHSCISLIYFIHVPKYWLKDGIIIKMRL